MSSISSPRLVSEWGYRLIPLSSFVEFERFGVRVGFSGCLRDDFVNVVLHALSLLESHLVVLWFPSVSVHSGSGFENVCR